MPHISIITGKSSANMLQSMHLKDIFKYYSKNGEGLLNQKTPPVLGPLLEQFLIKPIMRKAFAAYSSLFFHNMCNIE